MIRNCSILFILIVTISLAQTPVFDDPVPIEANGTPINVGTGGNASPFVIDWNRDGKQDLLLGQFSGGRVRFYENIGSHYDPVFENFVYLQADGIDISVSSG